MIWHPPGFFGHWISAELEQRFPPWQNNSDQPISGIVALGGSFNGLHSQGERFKAAVRLGKTYPKARVVFSGREETTGGADARAAFLAEGIEADRITVEDHSANTGENAAFSAILLRPKKQERWLLVTSALHMPRAIGAFRKMGFTVEAYPVEYLAIEAESRSRKTTKEILGLIYYRMSGRSDWLYPGP